MKAIKNLTIGTILSILIFFSVSFLSLIAQLYPFKEFRGETKIGFPFAYYREFFIGSDRHQGWFGNEFIVDCFIVWLLTMGIYLLVKRNK